MVFVSSGTSYKEAYTSMMGKALNIDGYMAPLDYIDIRGKGRQARETVEEVDEYIHEHHKPVDVKREHENGQSLLRVWHDTL